MKPNLKAQSLLSETRLFAKQISGEPIQEIYGKTDGKNVGTYVEKKFKEYLKHKYNVEIGNSARGIDLPEINVDIKVTSKKKPQSSSPFKNAREQIFGLGHCLLIFVYIRVDDSKTGRSKLEIEKVFFVEKEKTSDKELTRKINDILTMKDGDTIKSLVVCINKKNKHLSEELILSIAEEFSTKEGIPEGVIGISNAPQWRLSFSNVVKQDEKTQGLKIIRPND